MKIDNVLNQIEYNQVQSKRLVTNGDQQVNMLSLEKGSEIPNHKSTKDATIVVVEGAMRFTVDRKEYELKAMDTFSFGIKDEHSVLATENVKFLIIQ
jgi:quercetin dioxygenase-like cupin family protein